MAATPFPYKPVKPLYYILYSICPFLLFFYDMDFFNLFGGLEYFVYICITKETTKDKQDDTRRF